MGPLSHMGYRVGVGGVATPQRHAILSRAFERVLPNVISPEYMSAWGRPGTAQRLRKMANSIAAFCRNAKRRKGSASTEAIEDWEADLAWLKRAFYDDRFDFAWSASDL